MRTRTTYGRAACGLLLAGFAVLGMSCDTTQPDSVQTQTLELQITGIIDQNQLRSFNVYEVFLDDDNDGVSDDGQKFLFCTTAAQLVSPVSVPWPISVRISILRAGETTPEVITPPSAYTSAASSTLADTGTPVSGSLPSRPDAMVGGHNYSFVSKYRTTSARAEVLAATSNPLSTAAPTTYPFGSGLCSIEDVGPGDIAGQAQPFTLEINKGDTIIVESRKGFDSPLLLPNGAGALFTEPLIRATVRLDGRQLQSLSGSTVSPNEPGGGFRFSFTAL